MPCGSGPSLQGMGIIPWLARLQDLFCAGKMRSWEEVALLGLIPGHEPWVGWLAGSLLGWLAGTFFLALRIFAGSDARTYATCLPLSLFHGLHFWESEDGTETCMGGSCHRLPAETADVPGWKTVAGARWGALPWISDTGWGCS